MSISKQFLLLFVFSIGTAFQGIFAANFYVSSSTGSDGYSFTQAQSIYTPWNSLAKVNSIMSQLQPNDSVLFKCGDVFIGQLLITVSGQPGAPIVFSSYGIGDAPVITGLTSLTTWTNIGNGIWRSPCPTCRNKENMVLIDGTPYPLGRFPNATAPNGGFLTFESHDSVSITDSQFASSTNWKGGEIVLRTNHWTIDRSPILAQQGGKFTMTKPPAYPLTNGFGYFIQNHLGTLDTFGEWYYDSLQHNLNVYFGGSPANVSVQASCQDTIINVQFQQYISIDNLSIRGANQFAILADNSQYISVSNCAILYSGNNAIRGYAVYGMNAYHDSIAYTNNDVFFSDYSYYNSFIGNKIYYTGLFPGMGLSGNGSYQALTLNGPFNHIKNNIIDSTGYIPIYVSGDSAVVSANFVRSFCFNKDDGGGIYSWVGAGNTPGKGTKITDNIIVNAIGAGQGTDVSTNHVGIGIYMDDNCSDVLMANNTIGNCTAQGIFLHNNQSISCLDNTVYNANPPLGLTHDTSTCKGCSMLGMQIKGNIFFAKNTWQNCAEFFSLKDDLGAFGAFDSNYYCRPLLDSGDFHISNKIINLIEDLSDWQNNTQQDLHSNRSPVNIRSYKVNGIIGNDLIGNGTFDTDIAGAFCDASAHNCVTQWSKPSPLDSGALECYVPTSAGPSNSASWLINAGGITAGKNYILRFSMYCSKAGNPIGIGLSNATSPYTFISPITLFKPKVQRGEFELLFTPQTSASNICVVFQSDATDSTTYFDNVHLWNASITMANPNDYFNFLYNPNKQVVTIGLDGNYEDVNKNNFAGTISLPSMGSRVLIKNMANDTSPTGVAPMRRKPQGHTNSLWIYPNPATGQMLICYKDTVASSSTCNTTVLTVNNSLGEELMRKNYPATNCRFILDTTGLPKGLYYISVQTGDRLFQDKFMKID